MDGDNEEGEEVHLAVPLSAAVIAVDLMSEAGSEGGGVVVQGVEDRLHGHQESKPAHVNKKGKKSKRLEKEELKEREKKALALKQRISAQNNAQSVPLAVECVGTKEDSKSRDSSATAAAVAESTEGESAAVLVPEVHVSVVSGAKAQSCNTCGGQFFDVKDYRNHFRLVLTMLCFNL